jgi:hypothetical protein
MARKKSKRKVSQVTARRRKVATEVVLPPPVTDVGTEKTYTTTEPEVDIRKPATLAQALSERARDCREAQEESSESYRAQHSTCRVNLRWASSGG